MSSRAPVWYAGETPPGGGVPQRLSSWGQTLRRVTDRVFCKRILRDCPREDKRWEWGGQSFTLDPPSTLSQRLSSLGQGFRTAWPITGQKFLWKNLKSGSSLLTFRDLSSHICQIFMRMARWGDLHFWKSLDFRDLRFFGQQIWNLVWNGSIWLGRSSY